MSGAGRPAEATLGTIADGDAAVFTLPGSEADADPDDAAAAADGTSVASIEPSMARESETGVTMAIGVAPAAADAEPGATT